MILNRKLTVLVWLLASLAPAVPAVAHHSFAMFDKEKLLELNDATVSKFSWANPHSFVILTVNGVDHLLECNSTNMMSRAGWKVNTLKAGDKINATYYPLRNGQPGGMLKTVTLPDGKTLSAW
jgi:hypothetical protein